MDPYEVIAKTLIGQTELGGSVAMRVLSALDEAGLIVVQKPNYSLHSETGSGSQTPVPKPTLKIVT